MVFDPLKHCRPLDPPLEVPVSEEALLGSDKESIEAKGAAGEKALAEWFSAHNFSFISVCQNPETFAQIFSGEVKRPDFLLLFDALGLIAVDAKNLTPYQPNSIVYYSLPLEDELRKAIAFERIFRMPVWYAVMEQEGDTTNWYWISALKAVEVGYPKTKDDGTPFLSIKREDFVKVSSGSDIAGLYGQRLPQIRKLAAIAS